MNKVYAGEELRLKTGQTVTPTAGDRIDVTVGAVVRRFIARVSNDGSTRQQRRAAARGQA